MEGMMIALLAAIGFAVASQSTSVARTTPAVMFVCEHGAAKSVIATAYFNKLAAERGLPVPGDFPRHHAAGRAVRTRRGRTEG